MGVAAGNDDDDEDAAGNINYQKLALYEEETGPTLRHIMYYYYF